VSLAATGLRYERGGRLLLVDAALTVAPGSVHVLLGPNGAGKTTLLRALAGDLRLQSGCIDLDGRPLSDLGTPALARRRAVIMQNDTLQFPFTVGQVVALGRLPFAPEAAAVEARITAAALDTVGAAAFAQRRYTQLSGGERARVRLARALAQVWEQFEPAPSGSAPSGSAPGGAQGLAPRYLLLDEAAAHLDPAQQHLALRILRRFADAGGGALITLHDPNLALPYADHVTLLRDGRVRASGTPAATLRSELLQSLYDVEVLRIDRGDGTFALLTRGEPRAAGH
jgi:iron complex transport system ATP-binding protein